jgi:hypothetical protein
MLDKDKKRYEEWINYTKTVIDSKNVRTNLRIYENQDLRKINTMILNQVAFHIDRTKKGVKDNIMIIKL